MSWTAPATTRTPVMGRRGLLGGLAACLAARGAAARGADPAADGLEAGSGSLQQGPPMLSNPKLLVAGPAGSVSGRWAQVLAPNLARALGVGGALPIADTGGRDGVTGANAFDALTAPDGATAMLVPGAAAMAWLAGDPRVHFDAGRWVPALAAFSPAVVVGRALPAGRVDGRAVRIAASTASGLELPAILGLFLLGAVPVPVFGLGEAEDAQAALRDGRVDAIMLHGPDARGRVAALRAAGFETPFSLNRTRSPGGADEAPDAIELAARQERHLDGSLLAAWAATATAATMQTALVLPLLTPAAVMAQWRLASGIAVGGAVGGAVDGAAGAAPAPDGERLETVAGTQAASALDGLKAGQNSQLALRRWLADRPGWRKT